VVHDTRVPPGTWTALISTGDKGCLGTWTKTIIHTKKAEHKLHNTERIVAAEGDTQHGALPCLHIIAGIQRSHTAGEGDGGAGQRTTAEAGTRERRDGRGREREEW
jgi:hypothetical protein